MKNTIKTFAILFLLLSYSCKAQQMVQIPNDAYNLKTNEQQFLNKPLKNLLKEIKPEIKTAYNLNQQLRGIYNNNNDKHIATLV